MYSVKISAVCAIAQFLSLVIFIDIPAHGASVDENRNSTNSSSNLNSTDAESIDDRFNLNLNLAGAHGLGKQGGFSQSNALSYGVNAGIRRPTGQYQNLYSNSGSKSNGFSSGPGAPLTFANAGSRARPGYAGGNANAGVVGGKGSSFAHSVNQNYEIPLDNHGTVLLSNLKERNGTELATNATSSQETSTISSSDRKNNTDALVFA